MDLSDISWVQLGTALGRALAALTTVVVLTRLNGLRSFAKMAPHDFAATVAIGSMLAATALGTVSLPTGIVSLAGIYASQRAFQLWREHGGESLIDNSPLLLMAGDRVLWDNMALGGVTESDLRGKLREANVRRYQEVYAVILEGTGDISVLHGSGESTMLDPDLLEGVNGVPDTSEWPSVWRDGPGLRPPRDGGETGEP